MKYNIVHLDGCHCECKENMYQVHTLILTWRFWAKTWIFATYFTDESATTGFIGFCNTSSNPFDVGMFSSHQANSQENTKHKYEKER